MLLTKEIKLHWSNRIKNYYVDKGYQFTQKNDEFICKIEDLMQTSAIKVEVECDYCGNIYYQKYHYYNSNKLNIKKDACIHCSPKKTKDICKIKYGDENYGVKKALVKFEKNNLQDKKRFIKKLLTSANKKEYIILPFVYNNAEQVLSYLCKKHLDMGIQCGCAYDISENKNNCYGCICEVNRDSKILDFDFVKEQIEINGKNKLLSNKYTGARDRNLEIACACCGKPYITCFNKYIGRNQIYCPECSILLTRTGENSKRWKGGITTLNNFLRNIIKPWIKDSLEESGYKCDISNKNGYLEVHHLHKNFKDIVEETLDITGLTVMKNIGDYTQDKLDLLSKTCLELHYKYGLGVCILREYHLDFHDFYGRFNNTPEQYYEFKREIQQELLLESQNQDSLLLCSNE